MTRLDTNVSETLDVVMNSNERPSYNWEGREHILIDRSYPAVYTYVDVEKPMSGKFKFKVDLTPEDEKELHEIWVKIQNTSVKKK